MPCPETEGPHKNLIGVSPPELTVKLQPGRSPRNQVFISMREWRNLVSGMGARSGQELASQQEIEVIRKTPIR